MPAIAFPSKRKVVPPDQRGRLIVLPPTRISAEATEYGSFLSVSDQRAFALFFAREFEHKLLRATWEPASWYQERVGADVCSPDEAAVIRNMTIEMCGDAEALRSYQTRRGRQLRRSEVLDGTAFVSLMVFLFVIVPIIAKAWK